MLPIYSGGHAAYQDTFVSDFLTLYPNPMVLPKATWIIIIEFWHLDLSQTDQLMQPCYSKFGPASRQTSCMLRSYLLSIKLKITSITKWVQLLKENPLYAILSGFHATTFLASVPFMTSFLVYGNPIPIIFLQNNATRK